VVMVDSRWENALNGAPVAEMTARRSITESTHHSANDKNLAPLQYNSLLRRPPFRPSSNTQDLTDRYGREVNLLVVALLVLVKVGS
jgi:hypothetical protein